MVTPPDKPSATYALFEDVEPAVRDAYIPLLRWLSKAGQFVYDVTPEKAKSRPLVPFQSAACVA